jgi:hypothetical protein
MLVQLGFEALEQREGIGGRAGKPRQNAVMMQAPHLACALLDHDIAERDLAVAAQGDARAAAYRNDRGSVKILHGIGPGRKDQGSRWGRSDAAQLHPCDRVDSEQGEQRAHQIVDVVELDGGPALPQASEHRQHAGRR